MGGAVAINISRADSGKWDGMILVAPMCKVSMSTRLLEVRSKSSRVRCPVQTFSLVYQELGSKNVDTCITRQSSTSP
jgi:alpha-beta hydrolase superfamily lysophospholipase